MREVAQAEWNVGEWRRRRGGCGSGGGEYGKKQVRLRVTWRQLVARFEEREREGSSDGPESEDRKAVGNDGAGEREREKRRKIWRLESARRVVLGGRYWR